MSEYPLWWEWVSGHIKPIPIWDPILRFVKDYNDILTKEQKFKLAGIQARLQTEALKIRKEFDAKISELGVQAATEVQKMSAPIK
jgi:hypothetical protein